MKVAPPINLQLPADSSPPSYRELAGRIQSGDGGALTTLWRQHQARVFDFISSKVRGAAHRADVQDLEQATWELIFRRAAQEEYADLDDPEFEAVTITIATGVVNSFWRKHFGPQGHAVLESLPENVDELPGLQGISPSSLVEARDYLKAILEFVDSLGNSGHARAVAAWRLELLYEKSQVEIGEILGQSPRIVSKNIARISEIVKKRFGSE